jgi:hypothetical protein
MGINKFESRFEKIKRFQKFHPSDFDFSDRTLESNLKKKSFLTKICFSLGIRKAS